MPYGHQEKKNALHLPGLHYVSDTIWAIGRVHHIVLFHVQWKGFHKRIPRTQVSSACTQLFTDHCGSKVRTEDNVDTFAPLARTSTPVSLATPITLENNPSLTMTKGPVQLLNTVKTQKNEKCDYHQNPRWAGLAA